MKEQTRNKPAESRLIRSIRTALLGGMALGLIGCASVDSSSSTAGTQPPPVRQASGAVPSSTSNQTTIPELGGADAAEAQRLIDEINRDGAPLNYPGYREEVPEPVAPQGDDVVELNYEQADLRLVLEELAAAVDITLVADPSIDGSVTIRTSPNRPLSRDDIWPLIRVITRNNGVTLERLGDFYAAYAVSSALPTEIVTPQTLNQTRGNTVTQITPLTYVSTDSAREVLDPMLPEGAIVRLTNRNVLAITGTQSQLERVNELLTLIDADPFSGQGIQLYQLNFASAEEVATELTEILAQIEGPTPSYQVKGISRINALLVTAPATRGFEEVTRWIRILDSENQEQVQQLFYYQVKNLSAVELAATLMDVFEEDDNTLLPRIFDPAQGAFVNPLANQTQGIVAVDSAEPQNLQGQLGQADATGAVSANLRVRIVADEATNSLLIRSSARDYRQLLTTINQLDAVPLQVIVNAVIAQITLSDETRFGVDWSRVAADANDPLSTSTSTQFLPQPDPNNPNSQGGLGGLLFTKSFVDGSARVEATLEAIAANNEVRLLARPSISVTNNQEGRIQIGSRVPVQQGETVGVGGTTTSNIQYVDTGIVLNITPQINADGVVNMIIEQELSSVDSAAGGVGGNPVFNSQDISTTVVVRNGESVVLGGLIQSDNGRLNTGIPGLNRIPVLGNLFSYQQNTEERQELFIVLRPEVIDLNAQATLSYSEILDRFELIADVFEDAGL